MRQQFGAPKKEQKDAGAERGANVVAQLEQMKVEIPDIVGKSPGMQIGSIASAVGMPVEITQNLVRPLVGTALRTEGARRGTRYYRIDS
jgi:hypothetical protein